MTREAADYLGDFHFDDLSASMVAKLKTCLVDWLAVALAGSGEDAARAVRDYVLSCPGPGRATLLTTESRLSPAQAAFANATAGHVLDYDDVTTLGSGHPSAPVIPAVLAVAEELDAGGKDLLAGVAAGVTVALMLGLPVMPGHYARGFHNTATFGRLGAAAGACVAARLSAEACLHALAVAATTVSGLRGGFGTMMKSLQVGWASMGGLMAYELARRGVVGPDDLLEGHHGLFAAMAPGVNAETLEMVRGGLKGGRAGLRGGPSLCERALETIRLKRFPACFSTHGAIQAAIEARPRLPNLTRITEIECIVHPQCLDIAVNPQPKTGLEAKFSVQYCLAMALVDGRVGLNSFEDARALRPEVATLAAKVRVVPEPSFAGDRRCRLIIGQEDGSRVESDVRVLEPLSPGVEWKLATAKLAEACELRLGSAALGDRLSELIEQLEELRTVRDLTSLVRDR